MAETFRRENRYLVIKHKDRKYDAALGNKDRIAHPKQEKEGGEG